MELSHIIAFNLTLAVAILSPGPAMLISLRQTLLNGRSTGILTGLGLGTMAAIWTIFALLGLEGLFQLFPWAYVTMKSIGALYLIWIAYNTWRSAKEPLRSIAAPPKGRAFLTGLSVNFANPKSVLFASAVLLVIFPRDMSVADKSFVVINHLLVEWSFYTGFALLLSTNRAKNGYLRLKPIFDRVAALVLGALGVRLLLDRS
ncbi:LysE family translocator [Cognatishimia activa]|uniref:Threonine efflux protein n=1 Tax=Cognatishimia activa TaxID=1715691 RepID=A0A0P1ITX7_9RHOB|nr:LysE family translocator [Cognatishimia activa]MEE2943936.1 LysE family translocator [Pseudomonadota bacterium]CUJ35202.1 Threonine efflux protein [Cognatishimia activa]CUK27045.1 Threonine efflux protein [Cognatishimia activa]